MPPADSFSRTSVKIIKFSHIWTIENSSLLLADYIITSPPFGAGSDPETRWSLELYPRKQLKKDGQDYLWLRLYRVSSKLHETRAKFGISLWNTDGRAFETRVPNGLCLCTPQNASSDLLSLIPLTSLLESDKGYLPSDELTVRCELSYTVGIEDIPSQESQIKPDCDSTGLPRQLYENRMLCDVTLSLDGKDFPAHRAVLAARSPVLQAIFELDHKRGKMSQIDILDMEEETFRDLLRFIYTGETDVPDNMRNLLDTIDIHVRRRF